MRSRLFKYCHMLVTTRGVWIHCWIYWTLKTRDCTVQISVTHTSLLNLFQPSLDVAWERIPTTSSASMLKYLPASDCLAANPLLQLNSPLQLSHDGDLLSAHGWLSTESESKLCYDRLSVGQSILVSSTHLGLMTRFLLLLDSCWFVDVERYLWREDGFVVYNSCWASPAQSF
jgi:hypothetical protein